MSHFLGSALGDDLAPTDTSLGADIDNMIGTLDEIHVVFDDHNGVPLDHQTLQDLNQFLDILVVEPDSRLIEEIDGPFDMLAIEFGRNLDALGLTTREGSRRLAEPEVAESYFIQGPEPISDSRDISEE